MCTIRFGMQEWLDLRDFFCIEIIFIFERKTYSIFLLTSLTSNYLKSNNRFSQIGIKGRIRRRNLGNK